MGFRRTKLHRKTRGTGARRERSFRPSSKKIGTEENMTLTESRHRTRGPKKPGGGEGHIILENPPKKK